MAVKEHQYTFKPVCYTLDMSIYRNGFNCTRVDLNKINLMKLLHRNCQ